jgi:hypothetical protein
MEAIMKRNVRILLICTSSFLLIYSAGLFLQQPWATRVWLWPQAPPLSNVFMSSVGAAIALPVLWASLSGKLGALRAGALDLLVTYVGLAFYLIPAASQLGQPQLRVYGWLFGLSIPAMVGVYFYSRRFPLSDGRPAPALVRWTFLALSLWLIPVGFGLVRCWPHVFPWPLAPDMSVVYGWIFLGAAVYMLHGFFWPSWDNACGQLLGYLIYDLVLIVPYLKLVPVVKPEHQMSLTIYLTVIIYTGLLAIYYLFIHPATRLWARKSEQFKWSSAQV